MSKAKIKNVNRKNLDAVPDKDTCWESGLTVSNTCPYKKDIDIHIRQIDLDKLLALETEFPRLEFSIYFDVEEVKDIGLVITNIRVPKQTVSYASIEYDEPEHSYGVIHKHPSGMNRFSTTDEEYINANHDVSLLLVDGKISMGTARIVTPCKHLMLVSVNMFTIKEIDDDITKFVSENKDKIQEHTFETNITKPRFLSNNKYYDNSFVTEEQKQINLQDKTNVCSICYIQIPKKQHRRCKLCSIPMCKSCFDENKGVCHECVYVHSAADYNNAKQLDNVQNYLF